MNSTMDIILDNFRNQDENSSALDILLAEISIEVAYQTCLMELSNI